MEERPLGGQRLLLPGAVVSTCEGCGGALTGRQRKWCSEQCQQDGRRWDWILQTYGLTRDDYTAICVFQDWTCPICLRFLDQVGGVPHIDHEHGAHVRGIVCQYCNTRIIGRLKDWETAQRLADYLKDPPAIQVVGMVIAPGRRPRRRRRRKT